MTSCRSDLSPSEIEAELATLTLIVDTREQDTAMLRRRLEATGLPVIREKLDFADYSCRTDHFDFRDRFAVERKMSIDEVAQNLTRGRKRFAREFERANAVHAKVYLLIENGSWEAICGHKYRTLVHPNALLASLFTWQARYHAPVLFCRPETTPRILREVLLREARNELERIAQGAGD